LFTNNVRFVDQLGPYPHDRKRKKERDVDDEVVSAG
jgi:hypothetical protein